MKEYLNQLSRLIFILSISAILQACGGSSGGQSDKYTISANTSSISFSNEFLQVSDDSYQVDINFQGNGLLVGFAPDSQPVSWLSFRTENVTDHSATLYIDVINAENIIANQYNTKLRLSTGDVDNINLVHHDIDVSLLIWQLTTDKPLVSFRATLGDNTLANQTLSITSEGNQWQAETDVDWLTLDVNQGTGDGVITITPDITNFNAAGLFQGNIILTETTTGDSKLIPVEVGLDRHYLYANQASIGFSKLANINVTSTTLSINTNSPSAVNWQATTDASWLTLAPKNNSELLVSVDLASEFSQAQNDAIITVNALDANGQVDESVVAETIHVSFYQSAAMAENKTIEALAINSNAMVNSPWRPYVYVGTTNQLSVFHQYTGELVTTIDVAPASSLLEGFIISPDGELLIAKADETIVNDDQSTTTTTHRYQVNLSDYTVNELTDTTIEYEPLRFVSFAGRDFVVTQALEFADSNLQRLYWNTGGAYFTSRVDQAINTQAFYALDLSDSSFKRYTANINDFTSETIVVSQTHQYRPELLEEEQSVSQFIVDDNEMGIYAISPTSEWISFDGDQFVDHGLLAQAENLTSLTLAKSHNNRAHYLRFDPSQGFVVDIYDDTQQLINTIATLGKQPSSASLSYDDKRMFINASNSEQLEIITIEQLQFSEQSLTFNTTFGDNNIATQSVTLSGASDQWHASSDSDWLVLSNENSGDVVQLVATIDTTKISGWGLFTAHITITDPQSGSSSVITASLAVDEVRLFASSASLAFNQQLDRNQLTQTVDVLTNKQNQVAWQATADADWLSLTADVDNNTLTITAEPSLVTSDGQYQATITLSAQNSSDSVDGSIKVNFVKGNFDTTDFSELVIDNVVPNDAAIVLDPMRPYLYVGQGDNISVYNIIDGKKITDISSPLAGIDLTNLVIHPDASLLFASNIESYLDDNNTEQTRKNYYQINLTDFSITQLTAETIDINYSPIKIAMVSGKPVVITEALELADLSLKQQYWDSENAFLTSSVTDVASNNNIIAYDSTALNLTHQTLAYNAFAEHKATVTTAIDYINSAFQSGLSDVAVNKDGSDIYTINSSSEWTTFDGVSFNDQGTLDGNPLTAPVAVATDNSDNSYFYRFDYTIGYFTLTKYDSNQAAVWASAYTAGSTQVYLSPDYQRVIHYNSNENKFVIDYMKQ